MIQRFHEVIERRSILQAKTFIEGSSKLSLANITDETLESVETRGPEYEPRCHRKTEVGKVRWGEDSEEEREERRGSCTEAETEVICENFNLIVLRPQLGNNNTGREYCGLGGGGGGKSQLYFGNVESNRQQRILNLNLANIQAKTRVTFRTVELSSSSNIINAFLNFYYYILLR